MSETQTEENMTEDGGEDDGPIFPLLNRRAPVLDRIRNNGRGKTLAFKAGRIAGESVMNDDEEELNQLAENARKDFINGAADALGVNPSDINERVGIQFSRLLAGLDEDKILTRDALETLGLVEEMEDALEEEPEDDEEEESDEESDDDDEGDEEDVSAAGMF